MSAIQLPVPKERNLYLAKQVDQYSMNELSRAILDINNDDEYLVALYKVHGIDYAPNPINLYIDSYGGYVYQCLGLLAIMEKSAAPIHTIVTGCAMSCGFLISISGHRRYCYDKSTFLYHQVSGNASGKTQDVEEGFFEIKRLQQILERETINKTKITQKMLADNRAKKIDWIFNAKQALKQGIVDEIL